MVRPWPILISPPYDFPRTPVSDLQYYRPTYIPTYYKQSASLERREAAVLHTILLTARASTPLYQTYLLPFPATWTDIATTYIADCTLADSALYFWRLLSLLLYCCGMRIRLSIILTGTCKLSLDLYAMVLGFINSQRLLTFPPNSRSQPPLL